MTKNPEEDITSERSDEIPSVGEERTNSKGEQQADNTSTSFAEDHNASNNVEETSRAHDSNTSTSIEETTRTDDQNASGDLEETAKTDNQNTSTNAEAAPRPEDQGTSTGSEETAKTEDRNTSTSSEDISGPEDQNTAEEAGITQDTPTDIRETARTEEATTELEDTLPQPEKPSANEDEVKEGEVEEDKVEASGNGEPDVTNMDGGKGDNAAADAMMGTGLNGTDDVLSDVSKSEEKGETASATGREAGPGEDGDAAGQQAPTTESTEEATARETQEDPAHTEDSSSKADGGVLKNDSEALAAQESRYEDDISEISDISDRGATVTAAATSADAPGATSGKGRPRDSKSPTPSSTDEARAEVGSVVPVPVPVQKSDGRSLVDERGEMRGEDRSEVQGDEGEDSRGQGQCKSEEELFLLSSLMNQQAEKEALQEVIDEKVALQKGFDDLKGRYMALEEDSKWWEEEASGLRLKCQEQSHRIRELEAEEARLKEFEQWGKDNEAKVKDLQNRLVTLAREDAKKDRRIQKLQEELQDNKSQLVNAERQAVSNEAASQQQRPAQQSKTCTIL